MIVSVVREHHWPPEVIGGFFVDDEDYLGLKFWYDDAKKVNEEMKASMPKK